MVKRNEEFSIKDLISLFLPKIGLILVVALLFGMLFGGYSAFVKDDTYTSSSQLHVIKSTSSQISASDIDFVSKVIDDYKVLIKTDMFLNFVVDEINKSDIAVKNNWKVEPSYVKSHLTTAPITDDILQISVTTNNQDKSYIIAKAISEVIKERSHELFAFGDTLTVKVVNEAARGGRNSKNVVRNIVVGFIGGAVASMLVIFVYSLFDIVIRDKKKLEESFGLPVIGLIPRYGVEGEEK